MFLLRLIHLVDFKPKNNVNDENFKIDIDDNDQKQISPKIINKETINQIKNVSQEKKIKPQSQIETKVTNEIIIRSLNELIDICSSKKEVKLKYELEKNVNLVKFENGRIEISFNDGLDKNFVKDLSSKLLEWTNQRWIISFSKNQGEISIKDKEKNEKKKLVEDAKKSALYKTMLDYFPDAELIDIKSSKEDDS